MIDKVQYQECFQYFDNEIIVEVIDMFVEETPHLMSSIIRNIDNKDFESLTTNIAKLKGSVINFCDPVSPDQARKLEKMTSGKIEEGVRELIHQLRFSLDHLTSELLQIRNALTNA